MKKIVISAINLTEGGPLSILEECLDYLSSELADAYEIIALVNNRSLFDYKNISFYAFPLSKKCWLFRLYYEYFYFYWFSKKIKPHLWFSLHDMTPNVESDIQAVYCQNLSPFYTLSLKDWYLGGYKFILFSLFYGFLYAINIKKNDFVIVQQDSIRDKFKQLVRGSKIIVAYPTITAQTSISPLSEDENIFFYPALPRVFKNFEVICGAANILLKQGINNFQVVFTISGNENRYAKYIYNSFKSVKNIKFIGIQPRDRIFELYKKASCLIFSSKLETWGIPINEAELFLKPVLVADLEYAHETSRAYNKVKFFDPDDPLELASAMKDIINRTVVYEKTQPRIVSEPFAQGWKELFDILLSPKAGHPREIKTARVR